MLNCESSEAKRICSIVEKVILKRSEFVYIEEFKYRSEANRFDSDFVFKKTKKSKLSFFSKTKGKKRKGSIVNYRSFAITYDIKYQKGWSCFERIYNLASYIFLTVPESYRVIV
jgi:hypothetical protein